MAFNCHGARVCWARNDSPWRRKISATSSMGALDRADDLMDGPRHRFECLRCQMRIDGRGSGRLMAENALDDPQVHSGFQQVRRVRMPQGMDMGRLLDPT